MARLLLLVVAVLGCVVALAIGIALYLECQPRPPAAGVTVENFERVQKGMDHKRVKDILGEPNGWDPKSAGYMVWRSSECSIRIRFRISGNCAFVVDGECIDSDGQVTEVPHVETIRDVIRP
jgi:hypothetical protein